MHNKGFTLIELLVTIAIFSIIIGAIIGIFISGVRQQRDALQNQVLLNQMSYVLEFMSRALRMASKESGQGCLSQNGLNYELTRGGNGITFINVLENNDCQEFFLEAGQLKYFKKSTGQILPLTSAKFNITSLKFNLIGQGQNDDIQPRVTFSLEIGPLKFQTTVSQRNLDVK
jgi:prepilin-type N-terminal cleavage/methylation domain-containing protein